MKKLLALLFMLALASCPVMADEQPVIQPSPGDVQLGTLHALNNVTAIAEGHTLALCGCGMEFEVTDASPKLEMNGTTFYCCSQACHDHASKASAEESATSMAEWQKVFSGKGTLTNAAMVDGKNMATCACGQTFEVTSKSPCVAENGMKMSACCDGCANHVIKTTPEERSAMMKKVMKTAAMTK
ncbi:MAG: hypothetical protein IPG71_14085 [bacterium]|nr:hypothetical protein [bacterium]